MKTTLTLDSITFGEGLEPRGKKPYVLALLVSGRGLPEGENLEFALMRLPEEGRSTLELFSAEDPGDWIVGEILVLDSSAGMEAASKVIDRLRPRFEAGPLARRLQLAARGGVPVRVVEHGIGQTVDEVVGALDRGGDRVLGRVPVKAAPPAKSIGFEVTDKVSGARFHFGLLREVPAPAEPPPPPAADWSTVTNPELIPRSPGTVLEPKPPRKPRRGRKAPKGRRS